MKIFDGYKTYIGAIGLILLGIGGVMAGKVDLPTGGAEIAAGLVGVGLRSFGDKLLDALKFFKK